MVLISQRLLRGMFDNILMTQHKIQPKYNTSYSEIDQRFNCF